VIPYRLLILFALISISTIALRAQDGVILGKVFLKDLEIKGAQIRLEPSGKNTLSDQEGNYLFSELETGIHVVHISYPGVISMRDSLALKVGETLIRNYHLEEDALFLHEMVVTGTRSQIRRHDSPVVISTVSSRVLEATQSLVISEGLNFTPGLRMENNCQNCGFNQLRMNGLDGAYSQILINSRPVFSALAGVYGLEMLPANMVDRIEVVRGGGSVLYGGNAIAGTVNIITKDPLFNSYEVGYNQAFTNFATPDRTLTFNAAVVSEDLNKGITLFGFNRERTPWDANGDGYSEITAIRKTTFVFDVFRNGSKHNKLKFGIYTTNEFRRGGNNFHLEPHQTDLAEQLEHRILNATIS
jgi:outer membrane receptor for ferrienterochelin and colicins